MCVLRVCVQTGEEIGSFLDGQKAAAAYCYLPSLERPVTIVNIVNRNRVAEEGTLMFETNLLARIKEWTSGHVLCYD